MSKLKIEQAHYDVLKSYVVEYLDEHMGEKNLDYYVEHYRDSGLTPMRLRWDVFHASSKVCLNNTGLRLVGDSVGAKGLLPLYDYMNDDNIDSALRQVFRELGYEWLSQK